MIEKLLGLDDLLDAVEQSGGRAPNQPTKIPKDLRPQLETTYDSYYGSGSFNSMNASRMMLDKTWLVCVTVSSFVDTFASHSNIDIVWCRYTPEQR